MTDWRVRLDHVIRSATYNLFKCIIFLFLVKWDFIFWILSTECHRVVLASLGKQLRKLKFSVPAWSDDDLAHLILCVNLEILMIDDQYQVIETANQIHSNDAFFPRLKQLFIVIQIILQTVAYTFYYSHMRLHCSSKSQWNQLG